MDLNLSSLRSLVPAAPCWVFHATWHQIYGWFDTDDMFFANALITHTDKHMQDTQGLIEWHIYTYVNVYQHRLVCTHSSYLYCTEWTTCFYKNLQRSTMSLFFKNCSLVEVMYVLIRFNKIKSFLRNTKNTGRNGVNSKTHAPHTERKITLERVKSC